MIERLFFLTYKFPSIFVGALIIIACLFLLLFAQGCINVVLTQSANTSTKSASPYFSSNPNAIAAGAAEAAHAIKQGLYQAWGVTYGGLRHVASSVARGGKVAASGVQAVARGIGSGIMFVTNTVASTVVFVLQIPINLFGFISNTPMVSAV